MNRAKPTVANTITFLMLPDDMLLNCLARVSRLYYPTLSLVSKRFRSLLTSLEIYETRTLLCCTENCLYVCLLFPRDKNGARWFTLCRRPTQITAPNPTPRWFTPLLRPYQLLTMKEKKSSDKNLLVSFPTLNPPYMSRWDMSLAAVGCNIYQVDTPSRFMFMDCRNHTWHKAPSMRVFRWYPSVRVLDTKIYITGGVKDYLHSSDWIECFNTKTQIWEHVPSPGAKFIQENNNIYNSVAIDGKLYFFGVRSNAVYKTKENRWDEIGLTEIGMRWAGNPDYCVIDNIWFNYSWILKRLQWYDIDKGSWEFLEGLEELTKLLKDCYKILVRLENYGGNIAVLWEKKVREEKDIWCAEIVLVKRNEHEIYGKVEWCNVVLTVPITCELLTSFIVTV
ncbi:PREDICTED: putative F-box/kelch-repeat protein At4g11750 [Camelina sativa]|uniref:F-box/kelch-repeat protein At4g11750 n=1 Tax=Camelina sativa TaxID=90675 RepID=A0ABM0U5P6_CAMSA|nr:PREDICTED: putative F-box/kelch-repeat protein At4g11750 [Camelina sativa]